MKEEDNFADMFLSSVSTLDKLANLQCVCRIYYGDNKDDKPNDFCYWDEDNHIIGWYENDEHLRNRLKDNAK